jgi:hypothetical protein
MVNPKSRFTFFGCGAIPNRLIGGDALATLFNRQKQQTMTDGGGNNALEAIWACVLLIHLGGQAEISAYSLKDNEMWKQHAITRVSQVTVALYVFCKWWSDETKTRLLQVAVLLFIVGILSFSQKPWALLRASYGGMTSTKDEQTGRLAWHNLTRHDTIGPGVPPDRVSLGLRA